MVIRRRSKASAETPAQTRVDAAPASAARVVPARAPSPVSAEDVAARAYAKWQARGCPIGDDLHDWYEAERELHTQPAASS